MKKTSDIKNVLTYMAELSDLMDKEGFQKVASGLDKVADTVMFKYKLASFDAHLIRVAGEKIDYKDWEVQSDSLSGSDWALNVSRGEEEENNDPILVKIQNGIMTVRYKGKFYKSGIQFKSEYFYSDKFKNSIARAFRGLQTGKVSFTHVQEMYDLNKFKDGKKQVVKDQNAEK